MPALLSRALLWLPLALFAGLIGIQLFGPVPIGLADNGDFARILGPLRLWPVQDSDNRFRYFVNDYVMTQQLYDTGVPSSEELIARVAKAIATVILPSGTFQLRLMGFLHGAFLTAAFFIFLHALRRRAVCVRILCGLLLLFIWTDLEYVQQLNTAYTDAAAIVALAVIFSIGIHCLLVDAHWGWALAFGAFGCFLLGTKTQHETAMPLLIAFCFVAAWRARSKRDRAAWLSMPALLMLTSLWLIARTPDDYRSPAAFSLVFYKLAVLSPDPSSVLASFQMPENEFGKYVGHYAYEPAVHMEAPALRGRMVTLVTPLSLGSFYWHHPRILMKVLSLDLRTSAPDVRLSESGYGHIRKVDLRHGRRPFEVAAWGQFRRRLYSAWPFHPIYLFGMAMLLAGSCIVAPGVRRLVPIWPAVLLAAFLGISSFLFASLLDAVETARHFVFFQASTDLTIVSVVLSICLLLEKRSNTVRLMLLTAVLVFIAWLYRDQAIFHPTPRITPGIFHSNSVKVEYFGPWMSAFFPDSMSGTVHYSNSPGSSARLSFEGTEITWVYARAWNRGIGSVKIDGIPRGDIDLYSPQVVWQSRTTFRALVPGKHTFEVAVGERKHPEATDRFIDIDALVVR